MHGLADHGHAAEKDLKVFNDLGVLGVDLQFQRDDLHIRAHPHKTARRSIVDPIMNIKSRHIRILDAAAMDIGLIGNNERGGNRGRCQTAFFFMIANGVHDDRAFLWAHPQPAENPPCHQAAAQGVILAMDRVADIMQIARNISQLARPLIIIEPFEDIGRDVTDQSGVPLPMFCIAQCAQRFIGIADKGDYFGIAAYLFDGKCDRFLIAVVGGRLPLFAVTCLVGLFLQSTHHKILSTAF